jgi:hypothetical protein
MKTKLKLPGIKRLKVKWDAALSNFAFESELRRYTMVRMANLCCIAGRGLHSSTFQLNLSRF